MKFRDRFYKAAIELKEGRISEMDFYQIVDDLIEEIEISSWQEHSRDISDSTT